MNHPDGHTPPASDEGTVLAPPYRVPVLAEHDAAPFQVAWAAGHKQQTDSEINLLLRRRLRIGALIVACGYFLGMLNAIVGILSDTLPPVFSGNLVGWYYVAIQGFASGVGAGLAGLLWTRRPLLLSQLRTLELVLVVTLMGTMIWGQYHLALPWLPEVVNPAQFRGPTSPLILLANSINLFWVTAIVSYGVFIPNTWRRCVAVVTTMALAPLALTFIAGWSDPAIPSRVLVYFLFQIGIWMSVAVAIAVYGSHRIEVLRQVALQARKLGQYQLKKRLGGGGMGEVYLAEHVLLRRPCAIKLIKPEAAGDPKTIARFEREVQATATLSSWHTIEIFDYGHAEDGTFYYVMEYLPGLNLEELVGRQGPLPAERVVLLLRQVCDALREAHAIGLIHRDIKPSNIIVGERGGRADVVKLLDFGLVKIPRLDPQETKLTQEGSITGTPAYMSPEQAAGQREVDCRTDIYSLGCVAYFLLAGQPPFVRPTAVQTLAAHLAEPVVPLTAVGAQLPIGLEAVVLRCLEKDPASRFQDIATLDQALSTTLPEAGMSFPSCRS